MSIFNQARKSRAVARTLFPAAPELAAPNSAAHGRDAATPAAAPGVRNGRLRYRSTPFYLKIEGLTGPRQSRYV
ncbi:hypothetical protein [Asticcacaulis solisilvae]|uniref:hypothetical protein n=1 Tax=Asticcacaulis solisilvae TaxID=1217274 RepID=UPI003FD829BC